MPDIGSTRPQIANRLREAREQAGLSQGQVAKLLGLHRPTVSEIEAGRRRVSAEEMGRFAEIYGIGVAWLMNGSDSGSPDPTIELAARQLARLKKKDLDTVLQLLRTLRRTAQR